MAYLTLTLLLGPVNTLRTFLPNTKSLESSSIKGSQAFHFLQVSKTGLYGTLLRKNSPGKEIPCPENHRTGLMSKIGGQRIQANGGQTARAATSTFLYYK